MPNKGEDDCATGWSNSRSVVSKQQPKRPRQIGFNLAIEELNRIKTYALFKLCTGENFFQVSSFLSPNPKAAKASVRRGRRGGGGEKRDWGQGGHQKGGSRACLELEARAPSCPYSPATSTPAQCTGLGVRRCLPSVPPPLRTLLNVKQASLYWHKSLLVGRAGTLWSMVAGGRGECYAGALLPARSEPAGSNKRS